MSLESRFRPFRKFLRDFYVKHRLGIRPIGFLDLPTELRFYIYSLIDERFLFHHYKKIDQSIAATLVIPTTTPFREGSYSPNVLLKMLGVSRRTHQEIVTEIFKGKHFGDWFSGQAYAPWADRVLCFPNPGELESFHKDHSKVAAKVSTVEVYCGKRRVEDLFDLHENHYRSLRHVKFVRVKSQPLYTFSIGFQDRSGHITFRHEIEVLKDEYLCLWAQDRDKLSEGALQLAKPN